MRSARSISPRNAAVDCARRASLQEARFDQVVVVDDERIEIMFFASAREQLYGARDWRRGAPHARARREDLERVGADSDRGERCVFERFGDGGVDADTQESRW